MIEKRVYLIGLRYKHHAKHSGYEQFGKHIGIALRPPVNFRWTLGRVGWPLNQFFARLTHHPWYSIGAHLTEWSALKHMFFNKGCLYHILYGDSDLWLLRKANKFTTNRLIATFHQPSSHLKELGAVERISKYLDAVILVSEAQRSYFEGFFPPEQIFVVHHGVDIDFFRPAENVSAKPVCLIIGSHLRDFDTLKQTIFKIWQGSPDIKFVAVGTRSDKKSYFPDLDDERIQFFDGISDEELLRLYQKSKVAIFSFHEGTANNAMLESMACGLPVVATDIGGIGEYVTDEAGILCPPNDSEALATETLRLLNDSVLHRKMVAGSRKRALEIDFRVVASRMCEIYSNVLSDSAPDLKSDIGFGSSVES